MRGPRGHQTTSKVCSPIIIGLWIKARGLWQGWTRHASRAPGRPSPRATGPSAGLTWTGFRKYIVLCCITRTDEQSFVWCYIPEQGYNISLIFDSFGLVGCALSIPRSNSIHCNSQHEKSRWSMACKYFFLSLFLAAQLISHYLPPVSPVSMNTLLGHKGHFTCESCNAKIS